MNQETKDKIKAALVSADAYTDKVLLWIVSTGYSEVIVLSVLLICGVVGYVVHK